MKTFNPNNRDTFNISSVVDSRHPNLIDDLGLNRNHSNRKMNKRKKDCPKTLSGKHIWREEFDGYSDTHLVGTTLVGTPRIVFKCKACGMINDLKK